MRGAAAAVAASAFAYRAPPCAYHAPLLDSARRAAAPHLLAAGNDDDPRPFLQSDVPLPQQPTQELQELRREPFMDWPTSADYTQKVSVLAAVLVALLGAPIALTTYGDLPAQLPQAALAACVGGAVPLLAFVLRLRVGWAYVSRRLTDRLTYFEVRGQSRTSEKDDEALMRDRLIEQSEVQPALRAVDGSLAPIAGGLLAAALALGALTSLAGDPNEQYTASYLSRLQSDDGAAAAEQRRAAQQQRPAYCGSRYYKALAGGEAGGVCD